MARIKAVRSGYFSVAMLHGEWAIYLGSEFARFHIVVDARERKKCLRVLQDDEDYTNYEKEESRGTHEEIKVSSEEEYPRPTVQKYIQMQRVKTQEAGARAREARTEARCKAYARAYGYRGTRR